MITIKDVANRAGVSTATASRALRNIGYIDKTTYEKVRKASVELGYVPNATAQQLKNNTVKTVGFIVSDIQRRKSGRRGKELPRAHSEPCLCDSFHPRLQYERQHYPHRQKERNKSYPAFQKYLRRSGFHN